MLEFLLYSALLGILLAICSPILRFTSLISYQIRSSVYLVALSNILLVIFAFIGFVQSFTFDFSLFFVSDELYMVYSVDKLTEFYLLLLGLISLAVTIYSYGYIQHYTESLRTSIFLSLTFLLFFSMNMLVLSASVLAFMFWWELMALSSVVLILYLTFYDEKTRNAAILYFIMTQLSSVFLFFTFFILARSANSFLIQDLVVSDHGSNEASFIFILLFLAFGIKAGLVPFHKWLIYAHPEAPSNISAILSGMTINLAVYGFLRFSNQLFSNYPIKLWWALFIISFGIISAFLGIIYALKEQDIKKMLAYSSVENIGIIYFSIGLVFLFTAQNLNIYANIAMAAMFMHILNHGIYKSLLFMSAGSVVQATKTRDSENLGGLIKTMPRTSLFYLIGCVAIAGLPPFSGFISEIIIFQLLILNDLNGFGMKALSITLLSIFSLISAMISVTFVKSFGTQFLAVPRSESASKAEEVNQFMRFGMGISAMFTVLIGLFSYQILSYFELRLHYPNLLVIGILLLITYYLSWKIVTKFANNEERISETWGCGILHQHPSMEYTPTGFSEPIVTIFSSIYRTKKPRNIRFFDTHETLMRDGDGNITLVAFFEKYLYFPIANGFLWVSQLVRKLYNNKTGFYIGFTLIGIILVLLLALNT